jgi:nucleoside-diphosphate-sugar epimerase
MADDEQNPSERSSSPEAAERPLPRERLVQGAVVITGITGSIGRRLTRVLHRERAVIGLDQRSFDDRPKDVVHHALALSSKRARDILRDPAIGAVVHLDVAGSRESPDEHARQRVRSAPG